MSPSWRRRLSSYSYVKTIEIKSGRPSGSRHFKSRFRLKHSTFAAAVDDSSSFLISYTLRYCGLITAYEERFIPLRLTFIVAYTKLSIAVV